jgi:formate C-acetyltransferase
MLSWNYWVADSFIVCATADGRPKGKFLSNAICPYKRRRHQRPKRPMSTRWARCCAAWSPSSKAHGNKFHNLLPNGASHTITFNRPCCATPNTRKKFKPFPERIHRKRRHGLADQHGGPRHAARRPETPRKLPPTCCVRVTGYNAYFTAIAKSFRRDHRP